MASCTDNEALLRPSQRGPRRRNRFRIDIDGSRITCCFVGSPQKHKTRFIISYTAQNRSHSVFLNTCSHCLLPDRDRRPPACSPRGSSCPVRLTASPRGRRSAASTWPRLGTTATAEEITDTAVTQPLVVAATLLAWEELTKRGLLAGRDFIVAGHSVGEIAAYAIAGVISTDDAVALAATRGAEMAKACAYRAHRHVRGARRRRGRRAEPPRSAGPGPRQPQCAGQIVAAGSLAALSKLAEDPPEKARVRPLATAGAFHTHYMAPATDGYAAAAADGRDRRTDRYLAVERRRPAGRLGRGRHGQAGRPADPAGALGPVHGDPAAMRT